jgi:hypothetical protein
MIKGNGSNECVERGQRESFCPTDAENSSRARTRFVSERSSSQISDDEVPSLRMLEILRVGDTLDLWCLAEVPDGAIL